MKASTLLLCLLCLLLSDTARAGFLDDAAGRSEGILRLAELGLAKSRDADLRVQARRLIEEHGRALTDLRLIARQRGRSLTAAPSSGTMAALDRLAGLAGDDVAAAIRWQLAQEEAGLAAVCRAQAGTGDDLQLVMLAEQWLVRLERRRGDQTDMR